MIGWAWLKPLQPDGYHYAGCKACGELVRSRSFSVCADWALQHTDSCGAIQVIESSDPAAEAEQITRGAA